MIIVGVNGPRVPAIQAAMQDGKRDKQDHDRTPYGWQRLRHGTVTSSKKEQLVIGRMQLWRDRGLSDDAIAYRLSEQKVPTRTGKPWTDTAVKLILKHVAERLGE